MTKYLLISSSEKARNFLNEFVLTQEEAHVDTTTSASQARRQLLDWEYDVVLINVPLTDENGIDLSIDIAGKNMSSIILFVNSEFSEQVQERVESYGIFVVEKPILKPVLLSALHFIRASRRKADKLIEKQGLLKQQLEDFKIIDRAKCCLIEYLGMTEPQAHRHIEKQAMDMRRNRRSVAEDILKTYEM